MANRLPKKKKGYGINFIIKKIHLKQKNLDKTILGKLNVLKVFAFKPKKQKEERPIGGDM